RQPDGWRCGGRAPRRASPSLRGRRGWTSRKDAVDLVAEVDGDDVRSFLGQPDRMRPALPAPSTRDQRDLVLDSTHEFLLCRVPRGKCRGTTGVASTAWVRCMEPHAIGCRKTVEPQRPTVNELVD